MTDTRHTASAGELCLACGLCCNGTLFSTVAVVESDPVQALVEAGLAIERSEDGGMVFRQPCSCFNGRSCDVYAMRPKVCRTFRCALLIEVEAGRTSVADARALIARALRWQADLQSADADAVGRGGFAALLTKYFHLKRRTTQV